MVAKVFQPMRVGRLDSNHQIKLIMLRRSLVEWLVGWSVDLSCFWTIFAGTSQKKAALRSVPSTNKLGSAYWNFDKMEPHSTIIFICFYEILLICAFCLHFSSIECVMDRRLNAFCIPPRCICRNIVGM